MERCVGSRGLRAALGRDEGGDVAGAAGAGLICVCECDPRGEATEDVRGGEEAVMWREDASWPWPWGDETGG